jgi:hypothetical protein
VATAKLINQFIIFKKEILNMKTLVKRIAVLTLAFALAVAGLSSFVNMNDGVLVVHDGPKDQDFVRR